MRKLLALLCLLPSLALADITSYEATVAADVPCHWWKLQETSGSSIADTEGGACSDLSFSWTGSPSVNQSSSGVLNAKSVNVNGSNQYARTQVVSGCTFTPTTGAGSGQHMSWEWWALVHSGTQAVQTALGSDEASGKGGWVGFVGGTGVSASFFLVGDNSNNFSNTYREADSSTLFSVDVWRHTVVTWDGSASSGTLKLYLNGSLEATATSGAGTCCGCAEWITFASIVNNGADKLTGNLQYMAVYGSSGSTRGSADTLTGTQALAHYNAGIAAPATGGLNAYSVKRPELPTFRDPVFWDRFVSKGYNTGLFAQTVAWPRMVGWFAPFSVVPNGHGQ